MKNYKNGLESFSFSLVHLFSSIKINLFFKNCHRKTILETSKLYDIGKWNLIVSSWKINYMLLKKYVQVSRNIGPPILEFVSSTENSNLQSMTFVSQTFIDPKWCRMCCSFLCECFLTFQFRWQHYRFRKRYSRLNP